MSYIDGRMVFIFHIYNLKLYKTFVGEGDAKN